MAKQGNATATPKLRFREFRGAQTWRSFSLIGLADERVKSSFAGGPFGSNLKASDYTSTGVRIIQLQNIGDGEFLDSYQIYTSTLKADELLSNNIYPGEILLSKMGDPVGRACIVPGHEERYVMCSDGIRLVVDERTFSRDFTFFAINFDGFRRRVEAAATGSTRKRIGLDTLKQLPLDVPQLAEQQKIADCLTSLDEVIAAQGRKVEALKAHKRGLMQQLFPREGETRPRLRFPEFRDAPEWEQKPLARVAENLDSKRVPITEKDRIQGDIPYYGASGVVGYVEGHIFDEDLLCISEDGANLVARTYPIAFSIAGKTWVNNHAHVLRFENRAAQRIVEAFLNATDLRDFITGMAQPKLNKSMLDAIPIPLPDIDEQQRIADCLSSIDTQITAESNQLAALKTHKQGLMQQLFPTPEAAHA